MSRTGRPREFDRAEALDAALRLFWQQGYEATSISQLIDAMGGISTASFYATFYSKEALFREAVRRYAYDGIELYALDTADRWVIRSRRSPQE